MNKNLSWWLVKIDRFCAWVLLISMVIFIITGYGMTKGIINPTFSAKLHLTIMPIIMTIAFIGHVILAVRMAFIRWRAWNKPSMIMLILLFLGFFSWIIYAQYFFKPATTKNTSPSTTPDVTPSNTASDTPSSTASPATKSTTKTFTTTELAKYNGQNGQPAYVAVDGSVYDVTRVFANGNHYTHLAGNDLSNEFYSAHVKSALAKYPIVGTLK